MTLKKKKKQGRILEPLALMVKEYPTQFWNDSCSLPELKYAIARGATGATTNPVIVKTVLEEEFDSYKGELNKAVKNNPSATEDDIAWHMIEHAAKLGAQQLQKVFDPQKGLGRISIQTNTKYYKNAEKLVKQALHFQTLAPNIQVKLPATAAGIEAIEEVTYHGVSINATVCFTVPQALAVAEAVERGLSRRSSEKKSNNTINPVCTIMVGRLDDWMKIVVDKNSIIVDPECLEWCGVAAVKHAYDIYNKKGYRTKLLSAAYRNHRHWSEFIGGNIIETIPCKWQKRFNASKIAVKERMSKPVDPAILSQLLSVSDFKRAYKENGLKISQFDSYGATIKTLLQFAAGYDDLVKIIRAQLLQLP